MNWTCKECDQMAVWMYQPAPPADKVETREEKQNRYWCDDHVSRGCIGCNTNPDTGLEDTDNKGRLYPCSEYLFDDRGFADTTDCVFCNLMYGCNPITPLLENEFAICIPDKNPVAPEHGLVICKIHFGNLGDLLPEDNKNILSAMFDLVDDFVCRTGINNSGYRVVINNGDDANQTMRHLHIHVIGGAKLKNDFGV